MNCRLPRVITEPNITPENIIVTLTGTFHSSMGYVKIDGTTYTSSQVLTINYGTEISVHVNKVSGSSGSSYVKLNGTTVQTGAGTYSFIPTSANVTITMGKSGDSQRPAYYAEITTP